MKIKGAFPVRWAAQNGADGKGVTIVKTEIKYAVSTSGTNKPSSGWQTTIPSVSDGNYLWTWTHVEYSDGTKTDAYTTARQGVDGKGIKSSQVTYSLQESNVNPESIKNWGSFPSELTDGYWLYTRTVITYSEGDTTTSYSVSQVGVGSYYAGVEEYYKAGESATVVPDGAATQGTYVSDEKIVTTWTQERPTLNASTPYLWNFEISSDSRGNRYVTAPRCIGNFAKGIVSIVETYAISAQGSVPEGRDYPSDIAEKDWTDEHFAAEPTNEKPYQWNKTTTTYNDGSVQNNYHISAVKGIDGNPALTMNLSNDISSFASDENGTALEITVHSTIVSLFLGTAQQVITELSAVCSDADMMVECVKDSNDKYTGEVVVTIPEGIWYSENNEVVITAKCAASTISYEKVFTLHNVRSGSNGQPAIMYELQPSLDVLSFARNEKGGYSPDSLQVYCGYIKIVGSSRTSYAGNNVNNLWKIDDKYEIMCRYHKLDGTTTGWAWNKDFANGTLTINGGSEYTAVEFIFTSATGVSQVSESNIFDREIVPVMRDGANGEATFYYVIPSADKITRKHDGTLIPATINCKAYQKTGTNDPELVTSGAQGSYDYYVGTTKYTVDTYTGGNITPTPWWTKIVFYLKSSDGVVLTQREILVENEDISPEQNLLNDTSFTNLLLDSSTNRYNSEVLEGEGVDGNNALLCNPDSLEKDAVPHTEVWSQAVSQPNDKRLLPSTWYTLSFYARSLGYSQINIKQRSNLYGFATRSVYLSNATHTLRIRGNVSKLALAANRELRVFIYKDDWSWQTSVGIKQSAITEAEVSFTPPSEGTYKIEAYCYIDHAGHATAEQTVYVEWYRLKLANRQDKLYSYCYPSVIDTQQVQVHDGNVSDSRPQDGYNPVALSLSWKRFYMVFKTKSTIPTDVNKVLFRIPQNGNSIYLSQMKLERGVFPTAWTGSNNDTKGYSGAKPYFLKFSDIKGKEIKVYQGVGDEEWYTIVYDDVKNTGWYTPKKTHTTTNDEVLTDASKWLMSSMNFVATSVFFAQMAYIENLGVRNVLLSDGKNVEGGMCHSDDNGNGGSLGLGDVRLWLGGSNPQTAPNRQYKDGSVVFANGNATFDKDGNIKIKGTLRAKAIYTTEGGFVTKSGKTYIDLETNVGNTYRIPSGRTFYLPPASEHEYLEITMLFGENSILHCETKGFFVAPFTMSDLSSDPTPFETNPSSFKSLTNLQSITIRSTRGYDSELIWVIVNQRGVFKIGSSIDYFPYTLFPDGRFLSL